MACRVLAPAEGPTLPAVDKQAHAHNDTNDQDETDNLLPGYVYLLAVALRAPGGLAGLHFALKFVSNLVLFQDSFDRTPLFEQNNRLGEGHKVRGIRREGKAVSERIEDLARLSQLAAILLEAVVQVLLYQRLIVKDSVDLHTHM